VTPEERQRIEREMLRHYRKAGRRMQLAIGVMWLAIALAISVAAIRTCQTSGLV